jgi:hypothetical protein
MKVRENVYGLSRSRSNDSEGRVTNMTFKPVCNTLHSQVGGGETEYGSLYNRGV